MKFTKAKIPVIACGMLILMGLLMMWVGVMIPFSEMRDLWFKSVDEFYQAILCRDYMQSPIAMGSFWLGHLWTCVFGDSIFTLRTLCFFMVTGSIAVACRWLYGITKDLPVSALTFFVACCMCAVFGFHNYDWNTAIYLPATLTALSLYEYAKSPTARKIGVTGAMAAVMVAFRIPMAMSLLLILAVIIIAAKGSMSKILRESGVGLASFIVVFLLFVTLMTGSPAAYVDCWKEYGAISGHADIAGILKVLADGWFVVFVEGLFPAMLVAFVAAVVSFDAPASTTRKIIVVAAAVCACLTYKSLEWHMITHLPYFAFPGLSYPSYLLIAALCLLCAVNSRGKLVMTRCDLSALIMALGFPFIFSVGSDEMYIRFFTFSFLPLLISLLWFKNRRLTFAILLALSLPAFASAFYVKIYHYRASFAELRTFAEYDKLGPLPRDAAAADDTDFESLMRPYEKAMEKYGQPPFACGPIRFVFDYMYTDSVCYDLSLFHSTAPQFVDRNIDTLLPLLAKRPKAIVCGIRWREAYLDSLIRSLGIYSVSDSTKYYRIYILNE